MNVAVRPFSNSRGWAHNECSGTHSLPSTPPPSVACPEPLTIEFPGACLDFLLHTQTLSHLHPPCDMGGPLCAVNMSYYLPLVNKEVDLFYGRAE